MSETASLSTTTATTPMGARLFPVSRQWRTIFFVGQKVNAGLGRHFDLIGAETGPGLSAGGESGKRCLPARYFAGAAVSSRIMRT